MPRNDGPGVPLPVLYAVACGSPAAWHIGELVSLAQHAGWQVCVVATPDGRRFIDAPTLAEQTGHPVRSEYKNPGDPDVLPGADAIVVAPATVNTVNKWACGIADTLALGLLIEGYGLGLPMVTVPYTNTAMAAHPAFRENLVRLRSWGVRVLFGDDVLTMPPPGTGTDQAGRFPWQLTLAALGPPRLRGPGNGVRRQGSAGEGRPDVSRNRRTRPEAPEPSGTPADPGPVPAVLPMP